MSSTCNSKGFLKNLDWLESVLEDDSQNGDTKPESNSSSKMCIHGNYKTSCINCNGSKLCKAHFKSRCEEPGNEKYDGYCSFCFSHLFPADPRVQNIRKKTKETKWVNEILTRIPLVGWVWNKPIYVDFTGGCCPSKRKIDLRILIEHPVKGLFWLCIEIDENQHKYYPVDDEENRYNELFTDFSGRYVFLRINPDPFKQKGERVDPPFEKRFKVVHDAIINTINSGPTSTNLVDVQHFFYDT